MVVWVAPTRGHRVGAALEAALKIRRRPWLCVYRDMKQLCGSDDVARVLETLRREGVVEGGRSRCERMGMGGMGGGIVGGDDVDGGDVDRADVDGCNMSTEDADGASRLRMKVTSVLNLCTAFVLHAETLFLCHACCSSGLLAVVVFVCRSLVQHAVVLFCVL